MKSLIVELPIYSRLTLITSSHNIESQTAGSKAMEVFMHDDADSHELSRLRISRLHA